MTGVIRQPVLRWRALTPGQATEVRKAFQHGARTADLAVAYGCHQRSIYRAIDRADAPSWTVRVAGFEATFQLEGGRPVQVTPWVPA
jgi:hypothetical protein